MGGRAGTAREGDGGDSAGLECHCGASQCALPDGTSLPAWARCRGGSKAAPECPAAGREASAGEAGF